MGAAPTPMQPLSQIRELLGSRGLSPRHALGQNFLIDHNLIKKLVDAAHIAPGDLVLEVGPGTGALTEELLARGAHVVAAELDPGLANLLRDHFKDLAAASCNPQSAIPNPQFTLIEGDALETRRSLAPQVTHALSNRPFKLIANLPYAAATPIISTLLLDHPLCQGLYITIQKEVADRILARPSNKDYGPLSIIAQLTSTAKLIATLPLECFWPRPKVTSAMIALERGATGPSSGRALPQSDLHPFADFVQTLFQFRRKQLGAILGRKIPFPHSIDPAARAESLTIDQLIALYKGMPRTSPGETLR
jgi:16S rRNA (adenine1518-N6/adenine1519-N6)-dimethyltransferase